MQLNTNRWPASWCYFPKSQCHYSNSYVHAGVNADSELESVIRGRNGTLSCIGENVTYICTVAALSHAWNIPSFGIATSITVQTAQSSLSPFLIRLLSHNSSSITSSLSFISAAVLNATSISCTDSTRLDGEVQRATVRILGECIT